jgi:hypothetical protein
MTKKGITEILACLLASLGMTLGCVDPEEGGGSAGGTSLYVFDTSEYASARILIYSNVSELFDNSDIQPSRRLSGTKIDRVKNLAWGGMCLDANNNKLYLVSESGDVVRIDRVRSQNGDISSPIDIVSFKLGASDSERLSNGKFGQVSINPMGTTMYITEANSSDTRIWVLTTHGVQADGSTVSKGDQLFVSGDKGGTGVAAANDGAVYAYFDDGNGSFISGVQYEGPRLRKGTSSAFQKDTSMIIGNASDNKTRLAKYGCLAVDNSGYIYLARHLADASLNSGDVAILVFRAGQFSPGLNQAPEKTFAPVNNLRVISHAVTKDWLVGALSDGDAGLDSVWIWKSSSMASSAPSRECRLGSNMSIRGLALDGKN